MPISGVNTGTRPAATSTASTPATARPTTKQIARELVGDQDPDGVLRVRVQRQGDDDRDGHEAQAEHGQSGRRPVQLDRAPPPDRMETPHAPGEHGAGDAHAEDGAVENVRADAVGVEQPDESAGGDACAGYESDHPSRVARRCRPIAQLEDSGDDQDGAADEQGRPQRVPALPHVIVADPRRGEDLAPEVVPVGFVEPLDGHLAGEQLGKAELGADQHEERAQGDDEAGQPGLLDDRAVEPADRQGEGQRERHGDVQGQPGAALAPTSLESRITSIAVAPVIAPEDRSNSPPIISSDTATAMIPRPAATSR